MIKELGTLTEATVTITAEDTTGFDNRFWARFGFSALLELRAETVEKHILYDTNQAAEPIAHNLELLGKSLDRVSTIYLSHCHYDHTDGLTGILEAMGRHVPIVCHPEIFRPCMEINPDGIRHIGITGQPQATLEQLGATFTFTREPLNLMTGVTSTGEIERVTSFEILEDLWTTDENDQIVQDHELDDSAVVLNFPEGLVIITGCCHAGIVNTMTHAKNITGVDKIHAVIGGLHFIDAPEEKIEKSIEALNEEAEWVFGGHCTGFHGLNRLANALGPKMIRMHTGMVIDLPVCRTGTPPRGAP